MQLGVNSVLFGGHDVELAFRYTALAGYDAIEISAIANQKPHLILEQWRAIVPRLRELSKTYNLPITAIEQPARDPEIMQAALQAATELEIPTINFGPGGKSDIEEDFLRMLDEINAILPLAERYAVTLCLKAHVGAAVYNTPTTLRLLDEITSPRLGIDMDPSHIYRAGENPVDALIPVLARLGHIHIRDCKGRQSGPGKPEVQANGRGDIDLLGYFALLHKSGYTGPVNLEIIGALDYSLEQRCIIAAESRGHMQACLQACGAH